MTGFKVPFTRLLYYMKACKRKVRIMLFFSHVIFHFSIEWKINSKGVRRSTRRRCGVLLCVLFKVDSFVERNPICTPTDKCVELVPSFALCYFDKLHVPLNR